VSTPFRPDDLDEVVHGRVRLGVLAYLSTAGSADFLTLVDELGVTKGNLSTHLRKLEDAGYVRVRRGFAERKTRTVVHLSDAGRNAYARHLDQLGALFARANAAEKISPKAI